MSPAKDFHDNDRFYRGVFARLLALYLVLLYPILRANRYYEDDLKRALFGRTGWDSNGRPLTSLLMKLLQCFNYALVDISPLTQIGSVAILAWVGVLIARRYRIRSPWMAALAAFPLGAQPFYLENLSFKFDSLSMSMAVFFALLPILTLTDDRKGWWLGILCLFVSLNLYQAAINAYLTFILLDVAVAKLHHKPPKELWLQFRMRVMQAGAGMLVYQLVIGIHIGGWVKQKTVAIHSVAELPLVTNNIVNYSRFIGSSFNIHWWEYITPIMVLLMFFPFYVGMKYAIAVRSTESFWVGVLVFATGLLLPLAGLLCVLGPILVLASPPISPRMLMGVGALLTSGLIVMQATIRSWKRSDVLALSVGWMMAIGMCTIASAYGNAAGEQKSYEDRIATRLADDLGELRASHVVDYFLVDGTAGYSPLTTHVAEQFPILYYLIPSFIDGDGFYLTHLFFSEYISDIAYFNHNGDAANSRWMNRVLVQACQAPLERRTNAYSLRLVDNVAVVTFHSRQSHPCVDNTVSSPMPEH